MAESIYWYDFETTGTDSVRDRVLQFAGLRTNLALEPIAAPQNFLCCPGNDIIPNPDALLVTGILMSDIVARGMPESDFARDILREFLVPETCVAGFNSLRFDDEFTRQMLYRNFHDPYAREWRGGNSRWDVIDLFRMAYALRPEGINWPLKDSGDPSFRLEDLTRANEIEHAGAHDALSDVHATIGMAQLVKSRQSRLYDFIFGLRHKRAVLDQLYPLGKSPVVHVSAMYPASRGCTAIVLPLCQHPNNNNGVICFDLSSSTDALVNASPDELTRLVFTPKVKLLENEERVALKTIHINKCPAVAPLSTLSDKQADRLTIDKALCLTNMTVLQQASGLVEKIQDAYSRNQFEDREDPDQMLYQGGFFSDADRNTMTALNEAAVADLGSFNGRFQDDRLDEMLFRYRARNHLSSLNEDELQRWNAYRWSGWEGGAALDEALDLIAQRQKEREDDPLGLVVLGDLKTYVRGLSGDFE
jgi:exodeoxyribonuclease-1